MRVVVCVKVVPQADVEARLDETTRRLNRAGKAVLDDSDTYGIEIGLRIAAQAGDSDVIVLSMASAEDTAPLRTALAMGASRAVVVSDEALEGSDALGTAKVLAAAILFLGADLIIAATESTDGYTGTMPLQLAELLGLPAVSFARRVELNNGGLIVERQTEEGHEEVACPLPCVVTVTAGVVAVRYPSIPNMVAARAKPIDVLALSDVGVEPSLVGSSGARQEITEVIPTTGRAGGHVVIDDGSVELEVVQLLEAVKVL